MKLPQESFGETIERLCKNFTAKYLLIWFDSTDGWGDMSEKEFKEFYAIIKDFQRDCKP